MDQPTGNDLFRHEALLGRIVQEIVPPDDVPDVLQSTWVAALRGPRPKPGFLGPWLVRVARNFAYEHLRSEANRRARERFTDGVRHAPPADAALLARAVSEGLHRELTALEAPYREAVVLRYLEELSYAELAARLGIREAAARQRVKRGLDRLRLAIARRSERRPRSGGLPAWILGGLLGRALRVRGRRPRLAAATALISLGFVALLVREAGFPAPATPVPVLARHVSAMPVGPDWGTRPGSLARRTGRTPVRAPAEAHADPRSRRGPRPVRGYVRDRFGAGLEAVPVIAAGVHPMSTERSGRFEFRDVAEPGLELGSSWVAVYSSAALGSRWASDLREHLIVAAPAIDIRGVVRDESGRPLGGVAVRPRLLTPLDFPLPLACTMPWMPRATTTDDEGAFALEALPAGCATLDFDCPGRETVTRPIPDALRGANSQTIDVQLLPRLHDERLAGRVVDEWGSALAGATVGAQGRTVLTGRDGTYVLGLDASPDAPVRVFAARAGRATRVQDLDAGAAATRTLDWTLPPAETIRGSVTSHDGRPLSGAFVVPWGEAPVCGLLGPTDLAQPSTRASVHFFGRTRPAVALTDDAGRFALGGFGPGAHRLGVVSSSGVLLLLSGPLAAREEALELVIPADPFRVLRGRVVDRTGRPARGVTVVAGLQVLKLGNADIWSDVRCTATTDAAGAFEFTHLPRCASTVLSLDHPPQLYEQVFVDPGTDAEVEIEMEPLAYFRLELADTAVDRPRVRLLDGEGRSVPVVEAHQSAWFSAATTVPLIGGRSQVLAVPRRAATIALDGVPQGGPSILWRPDGVTTIRG